VLVVFWVRSYSWLDQVYRPSTLPKHLFVISFDGRLFWYEAIFMNSVTPRFGKEHVNVRDSGETREQLLNRYALVNQKSVPYWALVLATTTLVALPWLRWRFSLRTLLIAITIFALALGILIATTR
jgi:hypothetical protein